MLILRRFAWHDGAVVALAIPHPQIVHQMPLNQPKWTIVAPFLWIGKFDEINQYHPIPYFRSSQSQTSSNFRMFLKENMGKSQHFQRHPTTFMSNIEDILADLSRENMGKSHFQRQTADLEPCERLGLHRCGAAKLRLPGSCGQRGKSGGERRDGRRFPRDPMENHMEVLRIIFIWWRTSIDSEI